MVKDLRLPTILAVGTRPHPRLSITIEVGVALRTDVFHHMAR